MATLTSVDAETRSRLRERLGALPGVRRVLIDDAVGSICILCEPEGERSPLFPHARNVLVELGLDPAQVPVEVAVQIGLGERQRVRYKAVERIVHDETHIGVRVTLEWQGTTHTGEAVGEVGTALELRTAARAALNAVLSITGRELNLRLTGVKQIRAFDVDLTVASIQAAGPPIQHYVGTVMASADPLRAAAIAVLNALNRTLGNYLSTTD